MAVLAVSRKQRLRELEKEIRSGMEEFYYTGMKLKEIRDDELYKEDGFETWTDYCREKWEWSLRHATQLITAAEYREKIPTGTSGSGAEEPKWSERSIRELTRIPDKRDAARVAKKVIAEVENKSETKLTSTLVRKLVDKELGVDRSKRNGKPKEEWPEDPKDDTTFRDYLIGVTGHLEGTFSVIEERGADKEAWKLLKEKHPGTIKRLIAACDSLAAFLRRKV